MNSNTEILKFISRVEQKLLKENQESIILSNNAESIICGGKNRHCSNIDSNCDNSKNKKCSNYNQTGCKDSTNKGTCSNTKPS